MWLWKQRKTISYEALDLGQKIWGRTSWRCLLKSIVLQKKLWFNSRRGVTCMNIFQINPWNGGLNFGDVVGKKGGIVFDYRTKENKKIVVAEWFDNKTVTLAFMLAMNPLMQWNIFIYLDQILHVSTINIWEALTN